MWFALASCNKSPTFGPPLDQGRIHQIEAMAHDCTRPLGVDADDGIGCTGDGLHVNLRTEHGRLVMFRMAIEANDAPLAFARAKPLLVAIAPPDAIDIIERHLGAPELATHWAADHVHVETGQLVPGDAQHLATWQLEVDW